MCPEAVRFTAEDGAELGVAAGGLALTWLVFYRITRCTAHPVSSWFAFVHFLVIYWVWCARTRRLMRRATAAVVVASAALAAVDPLGLIIFKWWQRGFPTCG